MTVEKAIIGNALELAKGVAQTIVDNSYRHSDDNNGIDDVCLFGSTARGESAHDVDILLIHRLGKLKEFGQSVHYKDGEVVDDPNAITLASTVLEYLGSLEFYEHFYVGRTFDSLWVHADSEIQRLLDQGIGSGYIEIHPVGKVYIEDTSISIEQLVKRCNGIAAEFRSKFVAKKVGKLFENVGLDLDNDLDLNVMYGGLLSPDGDQDERALVIQPSRDPWFWHKVLTEAKLYDRSKNEFSTPLQDKYPHAIELFTPAE